MSFGNNPNKVMNSLNGNADWRPEQLALGARLAKLIKEEGKTLSELQAMGFGRDSVSQWFYEGEPIFNPLARNEPFPNAERPVAAVVTPAAKAKS